MEVWQEWMEGVEASGRGDMGGWGGGGGKEFCAQQFYITTTAF